VFVAPTAGGFRHAPSRAWRASPPPGASCPSCGTAPPVGAFWKCGQCKARFDAFETSATCPACGVVFGDTRCVDCGRLSPVDEWLKAGAIG
jgi:DNA-directed RNA polymerase subunit RPC12/RpoP